MAPGPANGDTYLGKREEAHEFKFQPGQRFQAAAPPRHPTSPESAGVSISACQNPRGHVKAKLEGTQPNAMAPLASGRGAPDVTWEPGGAPRGPQGGQCWAHLKRAFRNPGPVIVLTTQGQLSPHLQEELFPSKGQVPSPRWKARWGCCSDDTLCSSGSDGTNCSVGVFVFLRGFPSILTHPWETCNDTSESSERTFQPACAIVGDCHLPH